MVNYSKSASLFLYLFLLSACGGGGESGGRNIIEDATVMFDGEATSYSTGDQIGVYGDTSETTNTTNLRFSATSANFDSIFLELEVTAQALFPVENIEQANSINFVLDTFELRRNGVDDFYLDQSGVPSEFYYTKDLNYTGGLYDDLIWDDSVGGITANPRGAGQVDSIESPLVS